MLTISTIIIWTGKPKTISMVPAGWVGVGWRRQSPLGLTPIAHIAVQDNLLSIIHAPSLMLGHLLDTTLLAEGFALAFIASVEILLSATAVDQLTMARKRYNKERPPEWEHALRIVGALPMTEWSSSSANVEGSTNPLQRCSTERGSCCSYVPALCHAADRPRA
jgi:hypothetical protein